MQTVLIDQDNKPMAYNQLLKSHGQCTLINIPKSNSRSAYDIANEVNKKILNPWNALLFLNINLRNEALRDLYFGIEILKEIRSTSCYEEPSKIQRMHIVLFSALFSMEKLLKIDHGFFIIASPATTFINWRRESDLLSLNLKELSEKVLPKLSMLKPYFKVSDHTLENRHNYSNLWAANRLIDLLAQLVEDKELLTDINGLIHSKPAKIRDAQFIYEGLATDDLKQRSINQAKKRLRIYRRKLMEGHRPKRILLIDDQAVRIDHTLRVGWQTLYSLLLFSDKTSVDQLPTEWSNEQIISHIDDRYDCILLDLMLEKRDALVPVDETRGAVLLKQIKKKWPLLPVIITTASNKKEKRKTLHQLGSEAYWIKEGIDERLARSESLDRFLQLPQLIVKLTETEFQFLKTCMRLIRQLNKQKVWWERISEDSQNQSSITKVKIVETLSQSLFLLRTYLHNLMLGTGYRTKLEESFWFSGIMIKLSGIISSLSAPVDDPLGKVLLMARDEVAQFEEYTAIDFSHLSRYVQGVFCYLFVGPISGPLQLEKTVGIPSIEKVIKHIENYSNFCTQYFKPF